MWDGLEEAWRCPGCNRTKVEVIRPTKQNPWRLVIKNRRFLALDGSIETLVICGDCNMAAQGLEKELGFTQMGTIPISHICSVVQPQPNARHNIDSKAVERLLSEEPEKSG